MSTKTCKELYTASNSRSSPEPKEWLSNSSYKQCQLYPWSESSNSFNSRALALHNSCSDCTLRTAHSHWHSEKQTWGYTYKYWYMQYTPCVILRLLMIVSVLKTLPTSLPRVLVSSRNSYTRTTLLWVFASFTLRLARDTQTPRLRLISVASLSQSIILH